MEAKGETWKQNESRKETNNQKWVKIRSKLGQNWVKMGQNEPIWVKSSPSPSKHKTQKHKNTISVPAPYLASKLPLEHIDIVVHERQHPLQNLPSIPRDSPTSTCSCSSSRFIPAKKNATSNCAGKAALWLSKTQSFRSSRFRSLHTDILAL